MEIGKGHILGWFGNTFLFLFITVAGALMFALPTFIFIFIFWTWATACAVTLWITTPCAAIFAAIYLWIQRMATETANNDVTTINSFMETTQFQPFKSFQSANGMIAINQDYSKIILCSPGQQPHVIYPSDIIEIVLEVNDSIESKSTSGIGGSLTGAALGGVLTGGAGAIVGAIAGKNGKNTTTHGVTSIAIKVVLKRFSAPLFTLTFLDGEAVWERTSMVGKASLKRSNEWWAILSVFKDQTNTSLVTHETSE